MTTRGPSTVTSHTRPSLSTPLENSQPINIHIYESQFSSITTAYIIKIVEIQQLS
uniref:Uncharacterized protein n=1 Tax=Arundo donax TaxID=35708 RepID=A0A0A9GQS7_ARUDO